MGTVAECIHEVLKSELAISYNLTAHFEKCLFRKTDMLKLLPHPSVQML